MKTELPSGVGGFVRVALDPGSVPAGPSVAPLAVAAFALAAAGSLLFATQGKTEPPPAPHEHRNGPSAMRVRGLRVLFVVGAAVGAILGEPLKVHFGLKEKEIETRIGDLLRTVGLAPDVPGALPGRERGDALCAW